MTPNTQEAVEAANRAFRDANNTGRRVEAAVEAAAPHFYKAFREAALSDGALEAAARLWNPKWDEADNATKRREMTEEKRSIEAALNHTQTDTEGER